MWRLGQAKDDGLLDMGWDGIASVINCELNKSEGERVVGDTYRKLYQSTKRMYDAGVFSTAKPNDSLIDLEKKKEEIRRERIKLQTANLERTRIDRAESRREMYFEYIGSIAECLPVPEFSPVVSDEDVQRDIEYVLTIADIHYGATFSSNRNKYSPAIAVDRFSCLVEDIRNFVARQKIRNLKIVSLGDTVQGMLRMTDLKTNDSTVSRSIVEVSKLIASFLSAVSAFVNVDYYHCPTGNHTQLRFLGAKANEISFEDCEFIIGNYIKDLCARNNRININLADDGCHYINVNVTGNEVIAMHGHTIKNVDNAIKDIRAHHEIYVDYLLIGHLHNAKEITSNMECTYDSEILVSPSFIGSDPYSDSILKSSCPAVKIYGFDEVYGHVESYKIYL